MNNLISSLWLLASGFWSLVSGHWLLASKSKNPASNKVHEIPKFQILTTNIYLVTNKPKARGQ